MRILTVSEMREVDRRAIEELGVPGLVLMENAAIGVADALGRSFPTVRRVLVLAGPGNNGGDGFAAARQLDARNYEVHVLRFGERLSDDAQSQLEICRKTGLRIDELDSSAAVATVLAAADSADVVIDALFGSGLSRPLEGGLAELGPALASHRVPVLAVDLPSGLNGDDPRPPGPHLTADLTVTFAAPQPAHVLAPSCDAVGELEVADLGVSPGLIESCGAQLELALVDEVRGTLPVRPPDAHKGSFGHVLLVAGGAGTSGAAILAARGAVRSGAGLVTVATAGQNLATVELGSIESMTVGLEFDSAGEGLTARAEEVLGAALEAKTVVALGPGLGTAPGTRRVIRRLVESSSVPLVLDADAINAFAGEPELLAQRRAEAVLTPHPGELARLFAVDLSQVSADRLGWARRAAEATGCTVLLKGRQTLVGSPDGHVTINSTGNPGMATGGAGDVLTGVLAALVAQGFSVAAAAPLAALVHGLAGDRAASVIGPTALSAGDLVDGLSGAFEQLAG